MDLFFKQKSKTSQGIDSAIIYVFFSFKIHMSSCSWEKTHKTKNGGEKKIKDKRNKQRKKTAEVLFVCTHRCKRFVFPAACHSIMELHGKVELVPR